MISRFLSFEIYSWPWCLSDRWSRYLTKIWSCPDHFKLGMEITFTSIFIEIIVIVRFFWPPHQGSYVLLYKMMCHTKVISCHSQGAYCTFLNTVIAYWIIAYPSECVHVLCAFNSHVRSVIDRAQFHARMSDLDRQTMIDHTKFPTRVSNFDRQTKIECANVLLWGRSTRMRARKCFFEGDGPE